MKTDIWKGEYFHITEIILYVKRCDINHSRLLSISHEAEFISTLPLPMLKTVSATSPSIWLFLYFWVCRKSNYVCTKSTFQFSWQRLILPVETECFHSPALSPSFHAFLVSLRAHFPSGFGTVRLLSSSRFGVQCHPKSLSLTGRVGGFWDMKQKLSLRPSLNQTTCRELGGFGSYVACEHPSPLPSPGSVFCAQCWAQNKSPLDPWRLKPDQVTSSRRYNNFAPNRLASLPTSSDLNII